MADPAAPPASPAASEPPPFAIGQLVYMPRHPQCGSLVVDACEPYPDDDRWLLSGHGGAPPGVAPWTMAAPVKHFAPCPPGWTEPPPVPAFGECPGANELTLAQWRKRQTLWLATLAAAEQKPSET